MEHVLDQFAGRYIDEIADAGQADLSLPVLRHVVDELGLERQLLLREERAGIRILDRHGHHLDELPTGDQASHRLHKLAKLVLAERLSNSTSS